MADFNLYSSDAEMEAAEQKRRAKITSLPEESVNREPFTEEEMIQAFEDMFENEWRKNK